MTVSLPGNTINPYYNKYSIPFHNNDKEVDMADCFLHQDVLCLGHSKGWNSVCCDLNGEETD